MASNSFLCILILSTIMISCSSKSVKGEKHLFSVNEIEGLKIGQANKQIAKSFGAPEKEMTNDGELVWVYDDLKDGSQRAALVFDQTSKTLKEKTILLRESDPESKLDYLLKDKFRLGEFREVRFPQCGMDFVPDEGLYVNDSQGISIQYSRSQRFASSISWSNPADLRQDILDIKNCRGRGRRQ